MHIRRLALQGNVRNRPHHHVSTFISAPMGITIAEVEDKSRQFRRSFENVHEVREHMIYD